MARRFFVGILISAVIFFGNSADIPATTAQSDPLIWYRDLVWSPDGTHLAFARGVERKWDIAVYDFDTAAITILTSDLPGEKNKPMWSPDSQQIAFAYTTEDATDSLKKVGIVNRDGTGATILAETLPNDFIPQAFSADGKTIFAIGGFINSAAQITEAALWALDVANQQHQAIALEMDAPHVLTVSPDGSQLALFSAGDEFGELDFWIATLDELQVKDARAIFSVSGVIADLAWSSDGTSILFEEVFSGVIYVVDAATDAPTSFAETLPSYAQSPNWSPGGDSFAFSMRQAENAFPLTIWTIQADGSGLTELTATLPGREHFDAVWSLDGTQLAFIAYNYIEAPEFESFDIWLIQADGSNPINLTEIAPAD